MGGIKKVLGTKVLDPLDVWGTQAEAAQKNANEQAALDRAAVATSATTSPTLDSEDVVAAREAERQRKLALSGQSSTILTSASGATGATAGGKSLLGS